MKNACNPVPCTRNAFVNRPKVIATRVTLNLPKLEGKRSLVLEKSMMEVEHN